MHTRTKISVAALIAVGAIATTAQAQSASDATTTQLERVEITGSAIRRLDAETAVPVQVLSKEDIARTGAANVEQLMQTISAVSSNGGFTASSASGATTGGISAISLRGLGSLRTLVLINGRRISPYGIGNTNDSVSVDVNSIPLAAIDRVEILKDGASSLYGSDAIAGVVNFILRKDYTGLELSAEAGDSTRGGGSIERASIAWGQGDLARDKFNFMIVGSYQHEAPLYGRDRSFSKSAIDSNNDLTSGATFPANFAAADGSFGSKNPSAATGCMLPYSQLDPNFPQNRCRFDPAPLVTLLPKSDRLSLFTSAKFALSDNMEAFFEASVNQNKQRTVIQPVPLGDPYAIPLVNVLANQAPYNTYSPTPAATILLQSSSPFYPTAYVTGITGGATPDLLVRLRDSISGNRDLTDTSTAPRLTFGVRGTEGAWDYDTALLYSSSRVVEHDNNGFPLYSKLLPLLNTGTVNFFAPNTQAIDDQILTANFTGDAFKVNTSITSLTGKISRELGTLVDGAGPVGLAIGAELRQEKYDFQASPEWQQGDIAGYGGNAANTNKSRGVYSLFTEINVPLLKSLETNLGGRYDHYQNVGNSFTPKFSIRWQPSKEWLVRGSASKGFRAPSLADLYSPDTIGDSAPGLSDPTRCPTTGDPARDCLTQFNVTFGGNPALKPEKSTNYTLGLGFSPTKDIKMGVEAFKIDLTNVITAGIPPAFILAHLGTYSQYVTRGPVDAQFPLLPGPIASISQNAINLGGTKVFGYDTDLEWKLPTTSIGKFTYKLSGTYFVKYDTENPDGTWTGGVSNTNNQSTGGVIPRWKVYQALNFKHDAWDATLAYNWQSDYTDLPGNVSGANIVIPSYGTFDAVVSYSGFKNLGLSLGVRNLTDKNPPYVNDGFSFQAGYDPQYADPRARFVYVRANYKFN
jgi:iron complex outermembrane receptor protein